MIIIDRIKISDEDLELYKLKANTITKDELELIKTIDYKNSKDSYSYELLVEQYDELRNNFNLLSSAFLPLKDRYLRLAVVEKYLKEIHNIMFCMDNIINKNKKS